MGYEQQNDSRSILVDQKHRDDKPYLQTISAVSGAVSSSSVALEAA